MRYFCIALLILASCSTAKDSNIIGRLIIDDDYSEPTCATASGDGDMCVSDALECNGALDIGGAATFASTLGVSGLATFSAGLLVNDVTTATATYTVTTANCGTVIVDATDNAVVTLPDAATANAGCVVTVMNIGADDAAKVSVSPHSSDDIEGTCCGVTGAGAATCVQSGGVANKDWINTKSGANKGDFVKLVSDGVGTWYILGCVGAWASEG